MEDKDFMNFMKELETLKAKYVGGLNTERMRAALRADAEDMLNRYFSGLIKWNVEVIPDGQDPRTCTCHWVLGGSVILVSDLSQLPEYLTHELQMVRDLARQRYKQLTSSSGLTNEFP